MIPRNLLMPKQAAHGPFSYNQQVQNHNSRCFQRQDQMYITHTLPWITKLDLLIWIKYSLIHEICNEQEILYLSFYYLTWYRLKDTIVIWNYVWFRHFSLKDTTVIFNFCQKLLVFILRYDCHFKILQNENEYFILNWKNRWIWTKLKNSSNIPDCNLTEVSRIPYPWM